MFASFTQRAFFTHCTAGDSLPVHKNTRLFEVARLPSSNPVFESRIDPVHTVSIVSAASASLFSSPTNCAFANQMRTPRSHRNEQDIPIAANIRKLFRRDSHFMTADDSPPLIETNRGLNCSGSRPSISIGPNTSSVSIAEQQPLSHPSLLVSLSVFKH